MDMAKLNCNAFNTGKSVTMSGSFQDNYTENFNGNVIPGTLHTPKRRRTDDRMETTTETVAIKGRSFLPVRSGSDIYSTENWKLSGTALFAPVTQDLYINLTKYDQISAAQGSFHTADDRGNFHASLMGHVVHFWRYDIGERKHFISLSILYINSQEFYNVQAFLQNV